MHVNGSGWLSQLTQWPPLGVPGDRQADVAHHGGAQAFLTKREDIATRLFADRVLGLDGVTGKSECVITASERTAVASERFADDPIALHLLQAPAQRTDAPSGEPAEALLDALIAEFARLRVAGAPIDSDEWSRSIADRVERHQQDEADAARRLAATNRCGVTAAFAWWSGGLHAAVALASTLVAQTERSAVAAAAWIDAAFSLHSPVAGAAQEHMASTNQGGSARDASSHRKSGPAVLL